MRLVKGTGAILITALFIFSSILTVTADTQIGTLDLVNLPMEGFEDPWVGTPPAPPGWRVIDVGSNGRTWGQYSDQAYEGMYSAGVRMHSNNQDEWLITPEIDLTNIPANFERILLVFYVRGPQGNSVDNTLRLWVDADNDNVFPDVTDDVLLWDIFTESAWNPDAWNAMVFDLTMFRDTIIRLAWRYKDQSTGMGSIYLDKVTVYCPEVYPSLDVGIISYGSRLSAVIKNTGPYLIENITWTFSMKGGMMGRINLSSNGTIDRLSKEGRNNDKTTVMLDGSFFGLGRVNITITAEADIVPESLVRNAKGFVLMSRCYPVIFTNESWLRFFE